MLCATIPDYDEDDDFYNEEEQRLQELYDYEEEQSLNEIYEAEEEQRLQDLLDDEEERRRQEEDFYYWHYIYPKLWDDDYY